MRSNIMLALKGMAMGMAEVVPGVSGGTIAFITGIYEELIESIKQVDQHFLKLFFTGKWKAAFEKVNGFFLCFLVIGMLGGIVVSLFLVTYLLDHHKEGLWGFFFGLIIASCIYIGRQVRQWSPLNIFALIAGAVVSYMITVITPAGGTEALVAVFFSGMLAISALILPGISGSFILLLLGMYGVIIPHVKSLISEPNSTSAIIVLVFALGCLCGLMGFSRVLSYAFKHFKDITLAILTGFMIGSLNKIWPWRNITRWLDKESYTTYEVDSSELLAFQDKEIKILSEANVLPESYVGEPNTLIVIACMLTGIVLIWAMTKLSKENKE